MFKIPTKASRITITAKLEKKSSLRWVQSPIPSENSSVSNHIISRDAASSLLVLSVVRYARARLAPRLPGYIENFHERPQR